MSRGLPVKRCAEFVLSAPGLGAEALAGGCAGETMSLSWTPPGRGAVSMQEPKKVAKATRVYAGGSHPFPLSPPAARGSGSPRPDIA